MSGGLSDCPSSADGSEAGDARRGLTLAERLAAQPEWQGPLEDEEGERSIEALETFA